MMNLYLTKISRSYVKEVMRYQGGRPDVVPKPLVSEGLRGGGQLTIQTHSEKTPLTV